MVRCSFLFLLVFISPILLAQDTDPNDQRARDMVNFLQFFLNTVGDEETSNRDKDVIINESYTKIFRDDEVQVEDDLLENRQSVINKDVVAYLKDVDFFFKDASFEFDVLAVERLSRDNGEPFYQVELNRTLEATSLDGNPIKNTQKRYIEINLDQDSDELKIASIYTTRISKDEELMAWWSELSFEWSKVFKVILNTNEEITPAMLYEIVAIDSLDLSGNQYLTDIEPLFILSNLRYLNISETRISDLGPLRSASALETLIANQSEVFDLRYLKYLRNLKKLNIANTRIRNVESIGQFDSLLDLDLSGNYISDFNPLMGLRGLSHLKLSNTSLSSTSVLNDLNVLLSLDLSNTLIGEVNGLRSMGLLKEVDLSSTDIAEISILGTLGALEKVNVNRTDVVTIQPLASLKNLKRVYCDNTRVTEDEANSFMTANKGVLVINNSQRVLQWWEELNPSWKKMLSKYMPSRPADPSREALGMLLNIDSLNLRSAGLTDAMPLKRFYKLRYLDISDNNINDLDPLVFLEKLEVLEASGTWINQVLPLKDLVNLRHVNLSRTKISDIYLLSYLGNLKYLNVDKTEVSREAINEFYGERPDVEMIFDTEYLSSWWENLDDEWKNILRKNNDFGGSPEEAMLHQIIRQDHITIEQSAVTDLKPLWEFISLKELRVHRSSLSDLSALPALENLEVLVLNELPIDNILPIGSLTGLKQLDLSSTAIDDLRHLAGLSKLRELNCSGTNLSNLRGVEGMISLVKLDCSNSRVNRLDFLYGLDNLRELSCYNTRLNNRDISSFRGVNPDCKILFY